MHDQPESPHAVLELWRLLPLVEPYPDRMRAVPRRIAGTSFFPGGLGLWGTVLGQRLPPMPVGGVMVVGQDFYNVKGYERLLARGQERSETTWGPLERVLGRAGIPFAECFFTNFIMGLRETERADGRSPAFNDTDFVERCLDFFRRQLQAQQPCLVLTLGLQVPRALAPLSADLRRWDSVTCYRDLDAAGAVIPRTIIELPAGTVQITVAALTHPSRHHLNVRQRRYRNLTGAGAESAILADAIAHAGRAGRTVLR